MRIRRVFVEGLFGLFDHEILMKLEDQITIIHAPNGFGKTAILRMITGLLQGHYYELRIYPFNVFGIEFEDGRTLTVETCSPENGKEKRGKRRNRDNWSLAVSFDDNERYTFPSAHEQRGVRLHAPLEVVEQFVPELTRAGPELWQTPEGDVLDPFGLVQRYPELNQIFSIAMQKEPDWLTEARKLVDVRFIRSERLFARLQPSRERRQVPPSPAVKNYAEELAGALKATLTRYAELSQSLDRTFPVRLVRETGSDTLTDSKKSS